MSVFRSAGNDNKRAGCRGQSIILRTKPQRRSTLKIQRAITEFSPSLQRPNPRLTWERDLIKKIKGPNGITISDKVIHSKKYTNCFVASDLVSWIVAKHFANNRKKATMIGQDYMKRRIIEHINSDIPFADENIFYRFCNEKECSRCKCLNFWNTDSNTCICGHAQYCHFEKRLNDLVGKYDLATKQKKYSSKKKRNTKLNS